MKIYFDFETNGLLRKKDLRIHCMAYAIDDMPVQLEVGHDAVVLLLKHLICMPDGPIETGPNTLVAHNLMGFDLPVLRKFTGLDPAALGWQLRDTKVLGSLYDPEFSGTHSLEDWGVRVQAPKDAYQAECEAAGIDPWAEYTDRMGTYCKQDVETLRAIDNYMVRKYEGEHSWGFSVPLEHAISAIMYKQAHAGWWFDMDKANMLVGQMEQQIAQLTAECRDIVESKCVPGGECKDPFRKDGSPAALAMRCLGEDAAAWVAAWAAEKKLARKEKRPPVMPCTKVAGPFSQVTFAEYDLDSRQQVIALLMKHGWVPTEYTEKGAPKFTEDSISAQMGPVGKALATRFITITRLGQLRGWMEKVREDGRIEAKAFSQATPTARMRHSVVVNVPKPGTDWGVEMRSLFGAKPGLVQVGVDASGLELRMLAHYMGDPEFTQTLLEGDIHWYIAGKMGIRDEAAVRQKEGPLADLHHRIRECEKRWVYALIYGARDPMLGTILRDFNLPGWHGTEAEGALTRQRVMAGLPKLGKLMERIEEARKKGWLMGLDGRKIYVRHKHAALNSLLQSAGSIVVKAATVYADKAIANKNIKARQVGHFHDEVQYECLNSLEAELAAESFIAGLKWAQQKFGVRCKLDGEYKMGKNWSECH